jgi:hypothetical protein
LLALEKRHFLPYSRCAFICNEEDVCSYREAVIEAKDSVDFRSKWYKAKPFDSTHDAWEVAKQFAEGLVELKEPQRATMRRIGLCYCQIMLRASAPEIAPAIIENAINGLLQEALVP